MASWILPKNERWGNFQYIKLPQHSFFGRIQDNIFFRDFLTFSSFCVNHARWKSIFASTLDETSILELHPHYTQYVGRKLLYDFKGQTNIYLMEVAPNVNIVKQDYLIKNESSFPARVGERKFE